MEEGREKRRREKNLSFQNGHRSRFNVAFHYSLKFKSGVEYIIGRQY